MNVSCPNCENVCSDAAVSCPKCGHPLKSKGAEILAEDVEGTMFLEIGTLRIVGKTLVIVATVLGGVSVVRLAYGKWDITLLAFGLAWAGLVLRAFAGMWASLERISQKS